MPDTHVIIIGDQRLEFELDVMGKTGVRMQLVRAINDILRHVKDVAEREAPVGRTGNLKRAIKAVEAHEYQPGMLRGFVGVSRVTAPYAEYVMEGTVAHGPGVFRSTLGTFLPGTSGHATRIVPRNKWSEKNPSRRAALLIDGNYRAWSRGQRPNNFLMKAYELSQPYIDARLAQLGTELINLDAT